jgi:hypothetical protein
MRGQVPFISLAEWSGSASAIISQSTGLSLAAYKHGLLPSLHSHSTTRAGLPTRRESSKRRVCVEPAILPLVVHARVWSGHHLGINDNEHRRPLRRAGTAPFAPSSVATTTELGRSPPHRPGNAHIPPLRATPSLVVGTGLRVGTVIYGTAPPAPYNDIQKCSSCPRLSRVHHHVATLPRPVSRPVADFRQLRLTSKFSTICAG